MKQRRLCVLFYQMVPDHVRAEAYPYTWPQSESSPRDDQTIRRSEPLVGRLIQHQIYLHTLKGLKIINTSIWGFECYHILLQDISFIIFKFSYFYVLLCVKHLFKCVYLFHLKLGKHGCPIRAVRFYHL